MSHISVKVRAKPDRDNLQLYFVDPLTGGDVTRSAGTSSARAAERAAAAWEAALQEHGPRPRAMSWEVFRLAYEDHHLAARSAHTCSLANTAMNHLERTLGRPKRLELITSSVIAGMTADWRRRGIRESSIACYLRHIRAALGWAHKMQLIRERPVFVMPASSTRFMKGRPITTDEISSMLRATRAKRPRDWRQWVRFLRGLWYSGLRLQEAIRLSWTAGPIRVDLESGKYPRLVIQASGQKVRRDELCPITPDFARWLMRTPIEARTGPVLPILSTLGAGRQVKSVKRIGRVISGIGQAAGVVVNDEGKHAEHHDLRRSFGTRWAAKVKPLTLKRLMRHTSIETTLRYYVDQDADDVAAELWK